jgi:copper homeostasis protein (lipoprotein)
MVRYQADAATIRLCATGARLPVAMEADYLRLERAYLKAQPAGRTGQQLLVNLEGLITNRPSAEPGQPPQRTLVVERFVGVHPGQGCPQPNTSSNASPAPAPRPMAPLSLRGTLWRLQALQDSSGPTLFKPPGPAPELLLAVDQERVSGTGGCNRLMGGFRLTGEELSFSRLASTKMDCLPEVMAFERRYSEALAQVRRWSIDKRNLLLQDAAGRTLLLFRDAP